MTKHELFLASCFDFNLSELNRIYRASDHKFSKKSWDENCLDKGPILTVIETDNGRVFGAYTTKSVKKNEAQ